MNQIDKKLKYSFYNKKEGIGNLEMILQYSFTILCFSRLKVLGTLLRFVCVECRSTEGGGSNVGGELRTKKKSIGQRNHR